MVNQVTKLEWLHVTNCWKTFHLKHTILFSLLQNVNLENSCTSFICTLLLLSSLKSRTLSQITKGYPTPSTTNFLPWKSSDWECPSSDAHPQVINYNCVKFHKYRFICLGAVAITSNKDRQGDGLTGWFLHYPQTNVVCRGILIKYKKNI